MDRRHITDPLQATLLTIGGLGLALQLVGIAWQDGRPILANAGLLVTLVAAITFFNILIGDEEDQQREYRRRQ